MAYQERRNTQRFKVELPLTVRWAIGSAVAEAHTRDVCSRGICLSLPNEVEGGLPVEIVMTLPHEITLAGPVNVRCLGRVQRSEKDAQGGARVAVHIERYEFLRLEASAA